MIMFIHGVMKIPLALMVFKAETLSMEYTSSKIVNSIFIYNLGPVFNVIVGAVLIFSGKPLARYWRDRMQPAREEESTT
jgi:hypothetical protein